MALRIVLHSSRKQLTFSTLGLDHYAFRSRDARRPDHSMRKHDGTTGNWPVRQGIAGKRGTSRCTVKLINDRQSQAAGPNT